MDPSDISPSLILLTSIGLLVTLYWILQNAVRHYEDLGWWDIRVSSWLLSWATPRANIFFRIITELGKYLVIRNITIGICIILLLNREWEYAVLLVAPLGAATWISQLLQKITRRERPDFPQDYLRGVEYSFPSGHTMLATSYYLMVIYLCWTNWGRTPVGLAIIAVSSALIILVGFSRIYLGFHFTTDVLGGWIAGSLLFILILLIGNMVFANLDLI